MKIKISKSQWEQLGSMAGWLKTAGCICNECKRPCGEGKKLQGKMYCSKCYENIVGDIKRDLKKDDK